MTSRRIRVADTSADPTGYPITFTVEVVNATATDDDPACVRVTVTNHSEDAFKLYTGWPGVFGGPHTVFSEERDPGLIVVPQGNPPGVLVPSGQQEPTGYAIPGIGQRHDLAPDTSESKTMDVLSQDPTVPPNRLPDGSFTFQAEYDLGPITDIEATIEWGFSLTVESPA